MSLASDIKQVKPFNSNKSEAIVNVIYTNNWMTLKQKAFLKPIGLSLETYNVLRILKGSAPTTVNINTIIERMLDKLSNASRLVDRLFAQGYATRVTAVEDRRAVEVAITPAGLKILEKANELQAEFEASLTGLNDEESETLSKLLDKLRSVN